MRSNQLIDSGEGYFAQPAQTFDIITGQYIYDMSAVLTYLPYRIRLLERFYPNQWEVLQKWEKNSGSVYQLGIGDGNWWPSYRFVGTLLIFNQIPNFGQGAGLRIEGYETPAALTTGQQFDPNFPPHFYSLLVFDALLDCLDSKEATGMVGDPEMFVRKQAKLELDFEESMNNRSDSRESVDPFVVDGEDIWD